MKMLHLKKMHQKRVTALKTMLALKKILKSQRCRLKKSLRESLWMIPKNNQMQSLRKRFHKKNQSRRLAKRTHLKRTLLKRTHLKRTLLKRTLLRRTYLKRTLLKKMHLKKMHQKRKCQKRTHR